MNEPRQDYQDPSYGMLLEIMSAASSLHMSPEPIPETDSGERELRFLSECDARAKHSVAHLTAATALVAKVQGQLAELCVGAEFLLSVYCGRDRPLGYLNGPEDCVPSPAWVLSQIRTLTREYAKDVNANAGDGIALTLFVLTGKKNGFHMDWDPIGEISFNTKAELAAFYDGVNFTGEEETADNPKRLFSTKKAATDFIAQHRMDATIAEVKAVEGGDREEARQKRIQEDAHEEAEDARLVREFAQSEDGFPDTDPCCENESRNFNGGCDNCGDPCL